MPNKTGVITYNLRDRNRVHRGIERNFNVPKIVASINSPAMQERVKKGDLLGYYGHWPRKKFGLDPSEGGLDKGRPSFVEPAFRTTRLEADEDGTIRHEAEFFDTDTGKTISKLHASKAGGFSSAIHEGMGQFFGFDYVLEPNFDDNRGYARDIALDSVEDMSDQEIYDAMYQDQLDAMQLLLDSANDRLEVERAHSQMVAQSFEALQAENTELLSLLATAKETTYDGIDDSFQLASMHSTDATEQFALDSAGFADERLTFPKGKKSKATADAHTPKTIFSIPGLK